MLRPPQTTALDTTNQLVSRVCLCVYYTKVYRDLSEKQ